MKPIIPNLWTKQENTFKYDYYRSIDFLPLFNFAEIIEKDDLRFLLKLEDYELLPECETEHLKVVWESIQMQYSEAEDSNSSVIQYTTAKAVHKLELEYLMYWTVYNLMNLAPEEKETKDIVKDAGLEDKELKWIKKQLTILSNRIRLKRADIKDAEPKGKTDIYAIIDQIEDIKGRSIDLYKTTVRQFVAIKKNIKNGKRSNRTERRSQPES